MNQRLIVSAAAILFATPAFCQQPQPGPEQQPPMAQERRVEMRIDRREMGPEGPGGMERGEMRGHRGGGMHVEFWKNPEFVKRVGLTPEQTRKLDDISMQGKLQTIRLRAALEEQEVMLRPLMEGPAVDERKADLQIDKVAEARASLEKAEAKQHIAMRAVLTADQWQKMHEPAERGMGGMRHGGGQRPEGPMAPPPQG